MCICLNTEQAHTEEEKKDTYTLGKGKVPKIL